MSQAAVAGGSLAGVICGLLGQLLSPSRLGPDFGLALQYGPLLFLGTSGGVLSCPLMQLCAAILAVHLTVPDAGVILTLAVPNWVIVSILAVMMALLAWRSLQKGAQLYRAETQHMKAQAAPAALDAQEGPEVPCASPFQSQARSSMCTGVG